MAPINNPNNINRSTKMLNCKLSSVEINAWYKALPGESFRKASEYAEKCLTEDYPVCSLDLSEDQMEHFYTMLSYVVEPRGVDFGELEEHLDEISTEQLIETNLSEYPEIDYLLKLARYVDTFGY